MCKLLCISLFLFVINSLSSFGQTAPDKYLLKLTDKNNSPYSIDDPLEYLSERALQRRLKNKIEISLNDIPVNPQYIDSLKSLGLKILTVSKWMNSVTVNTTDSALIDTISNISFIRAVEKSGKMRLDTNSVNNTLNNEKSISDDYGLGWRQINMLHGDYLHSEGYKGKDMIIAVLDAGFFHTDVLPAFDSAWHNNQIIGYKDFVNESNMVFKTSYHGMKVLSIMAGNVPGTFIGTAPYAKYLLLRSEDASSEYIIEEDNWIAAAEFADSAGADLINSSLGYSDFNDTLQNHSYSDMDGNTTKISIAADIAASKGIIVVTSAGNEGAKTWKYITAPADADSILTVGAVDSAGIYASFSSIGPSFDGRVKPDVVTMGQGAYSQWVSGAFGTGNGTSFASPILCGLAACLWQANPEASNMEIINAIKQSGHQYLTPDYKLGYGIPNFRLADSILKGKVDLNSDSITVFPNPFKNYISIEIYSDNKNSAEISIFESSGKKVYSKIKSVGSGYINYILLDDLEKLSSGIYVLNIKIDKLTKQVKVIKK